MIYKLNNGGIVKFQKPAGPINVAPSSANTQRINAMIEDNGVRYSTGADRTTNFANDPYVSEFFEYDVIPRYMREHPNATKEELAKLRQAYHFPQTTSSQLGQGHTAATFYPNGNPRIAYGNNNPMRHTVTHENTHAYRHEIGEVIGNNSGFNSTEQRYLNEAYNVNGAYDNMKTINEAGALNAEIRYTYWKKLRDTLGRIPTLKEMDEYINSLPLGTLERVESGMNGYGKHSIEQQRKQRYNTPSWWVDVEAEAQKKRDALIHVADNNEQEQQIDGNQLARWGGVIKGQHGILTPWYNLYNSKVGEFVRNSMFGKDYNLSDEEYVQKHGYAKPITGTGMLPGKTSMNPFEGVENLVKGSFGTGAKYNAGQQIMKTNAISKTVQPKTASNWDKFLKKSLDEQNKIVKYWDERYSTMRQLQANQKQFRRFVNWINKQ